jgi:hypothetical protein
MDLAGTNSDSISALTNKHAWPATGLPDGLFSNQKSQFG